MKEKLLLKKAFLTAIFGAVVLLVSWQQEKKDRILLFTKTEGFVHESISAAKAEIMKAGQEYGLEVDTTSDATKFQEENLNRYKAVVFLNTTGDVLNKVQQGEFTKYIQGGGAFVGIHSAADTEYNWPWYGKMVGGYFKSHPHIQKAEIKVVDWDHPSTKHLPEKWERKDEWYNYKNLNRDVKVLALLKEESYEGGENGSHHPVSWYHNYDGGRAFYTGGGHTAESYREPEFMQHLMQGILWAAGKKR